MVLEQFKKTVPSRIATYINEHNVKTPEEAAVLADDFVHFCWFEYSTFVSSLPKPDRVFMGKFDPSKTCNYCCEKGTGNWIVRSLKINLNICIPLLSRLYLQLRFCLKVETLNKQSFSLLILLLLQRGVYLWLEENRLKFHETGSIKKKKSKV